MSISKEKIIVWAASIIVTAITVTVFAFSNFQTKEEASKSENNIDKRLDRIENKLDKVIQLNQ